MATAESRFAKFRQLSPLRKAAFAAAAILVLLLLWLIFNWGSFTGQARFAAAYNAHIACSCRYIAGRDMASCEENLRENAAMISLADDPENQRLRASMPFIETVIAEKRGEYGCIILNEEEMEALD